MKHSAYCGDDVVGLELPPDVEVAHASPPLAPLGDVRGALLHALANPLGMEPLEELLVRGMKLTIAFDDACLPVPPMRNDVRRQIVDVVLELAARRGIREESVRLICAVGLHRKWTKRELAHLIGERAYGENVTNHDAEDPDGMVHLGTTEEGYEVDVNRAVLESDLTVYVNVTWTSMNGGWKSVAVGLGSARSINQHHNADVIGHGASIMEPERSAMHGVIDAMGKLIKTKARVFQIETVLNNDTWGRKESLVRPLGTAMRVLPHSVKGALRNLARSEFAPIGFYAGSPEVVHVETLRHLYLQQNVAPREQADVVIVGVPNLSPYGVFSDVNPILFYNLLFGYIFSCYQRRPFLREGGTVIALNPVRARFHPRHHPSYAAFFRDVLPQLKERSWRAIEREQMPRYTADEGYIERYRFDHAYHGVHPFYTFGMGHANRARCGRVLVVGAEDAATVERLGLEAAPSLRSALATAEGELGRKGVRVLLDMPPVFAFGGGG